MIIPIMMFFEESFAVCKSGFTNVNTKKVQGKMSQSAAVVVFDCQRLFLLLLMFVRGPDSWV